MKMNKIIKISLVLTLGLMFVISTTLLVSAHTTSQSSVLKSEYMPEYGDYYVGGESVGWSIDEDYHSGFPYMFFKWRSSDACLTTARKNIFLQGANKWAPCGTIEYDPTGNSYFGALGTFDPGPGSSTVAQFYDYSSDSDGHLLFWRIDMNWRVSATSTDIAHEFGHAFGLNDLYNISNSNKLMYGYTSGTATGPTSTDVKGFNVITGLHSSHSFNTSGVCIVCGGLKK